MKSNYVGRPKQEIIKDKRIIIPITTYEQELLREYASKNNTTIANIFYPVFRRLIEDGDIQNGI
jgi:hypothetical protein